MTRINRPDTLITELRDIKRRLRLLEAARMRGAAGPAATGLAPPGPVPTGSGETGSGETGSGSAGLMPAGFGAEAAGAVAVPVPLVPARPVDWPGTVSPDWERLLVTWTAWDGILVLRLAADAGSEGQARVLVDGGPAGEVLPVTPANVRHEATVRRGEVAVEARCTAGPGLIRASGYVIPLSTPRSTLPRPSAP